MLTETPFGISSLLSNCVQISEPAGLISAQKTVGKS